MSKGVTRIESGVFHFPKFEANGLSDHFKPHAVVGQPAGGPSLTRQEFAEECDVNLIMERYQNTGVLPSSVGEAFYADFTSVPMDMMDAMRQMKDASEAFMTLPAKVRREFDNDPAQFVNYAADPDNLDQMRDWGLAPPAPAPEPAPPGPAIAPAAVDAGLVKPASAASAEPPKGG